MNLATVAVTARSFLRRPDLLDQLKSRLPTHQLHLAPINKALTGQELYHHVKDAHAVLIGREPFDAPLLKKLPRLKIITVYGVGTDNIALASCEQLGIQVQVAEGVNADATAEHTIGLILATLRNIASNNSLLREGHWRKNGGVTFYGKTLAIIGSGNVGSRVAHLAKAMGAHILLVDLEDKSHLAGAVSGQQVTFDEAIATTDLTSVHLPLTGHTQLLFNKDTFLKMKRGSYFFNCARGGIVDEQALAEALRNNHLAGAGLDVFANEPIVSEYLRELPNIVMTPHTAGNAYEAVTAMGEAAIAALEDSLKRL